MYSGLPWFAQALTGGKCLKAKTIGFLLEKSSLISQDYRIKKAMSILIIQTVSLEKPVLASMES